MSRARAPEREGDSLPTRTIASRSLFLFSVLLCLGSTSGCGLTGGQRAAVKEFAAATSDFSTLAADEFAKSRDDVIEMNGLRVSLADQSLRATDPLDQFFTVDRVKIRVDALNALKEYADLLATLATSSNQGDLQAASDSFIASLRRVKGVSLTDGQAGAIGKAVVAVGGLVVEHMRLQAVKTVVESAHPSIQQVIDLVERDFDPTQDHWSLGYDLVLKSLNGRARDLAAHAATQPSVTDTATVQHALSVASTNETRRKAIADQLLASATKLRNAEKNLRQVTQAPQLSFEDIQQYAAQVEDFATIYKILRGRAAAK
jgi:hypothetical protein